MKNTKSKEGSSKKLILFDLDQTLVDVFPFHDAAVKKALKKAFGINGSLKDIDFTGKTIPICLTEICELHKVDYGKIKKNLLKAVNLYKKYFMSSIPRDITKYVLPGALNLLKKNKNNVMVIVTGTIAIPAKKILTNSKIRKFFKLTFCGDTAKNKTELAKKAIMAAEKKSHRRFGKDNQFLIGDSIRDIVAGKKNKTRTIGVTTGIHSAKQLKKAGADLVVKSLMDEKIMRFLSQ